MSSSTSTMPNLVLVTGANGYIASSLIRTLLEQGYRVRGTVRDVSSESKIAALKALPNASTHLELVSLELTGPQSAFENALEGVEWVFHVASPVILGKVKDEEKTVTGPAVAGTLTMLRAANDSPTVQKVVMTSSIAAIFPGHEPADRALTEDDWTNLDAPNVSPYSKSKTLSEQAAWKFMKENHPAFTLSVINPAFVLGPIPSSNVHSSVEVLTRILRGQGTVEFFTPVVDIRNIVEAHIQAAKIPEAAGKRFIICQSDGGEMFMPQVAVICKNEFGPMGYKIQTRPMPKWLVWLASWANPKLATVYPVLGKGFHFDNSRSREILKLEYIPAEQTIVDGGYSLIEHGLVEKKPGYKSRETFE